MKIHHFAIEVNDLKKSIKFYTEKLWFKVTRDPITTQDGKYSFAYIDLGGVLLELVQVNDPKKKNIFSFTPICPHIGLQSLDFDKDYKKLIEKGIEIVEGPTVLPHDVKMVTFLDPDNYRIDLGQLLK
jgi:catechol 2,3-dioxygenase-like lactoylglutathione lyase family enzyme